MTVLLEIVSDLLPPPLTSALPSSVTHQFSGKFCGNLSHYLKPGGQRRGDQKVDSGSSCSPESPPSLGQRAEGTGKAPS